jgi:hypothetical protein
MRSRNSSTFPLPRYVAGFELLRQRTDHLRARRIRQAFQLEEVLVEVMLRVRPLQRRPDQKGALDRR